MIIVYIYICVYLIVGFSFEYTMGVYKKKMFLAEDGSVHVAYPQMAVNQ